MRTSRCRRRASRTWATAPAFSSAGSSPLRVALAYATCCALWGSTWMVIRIGLRDLPPLAFAGMRMALAGLLLTPFALRSAELRMPRRRWAAVAVTGLLQIGIPYALMFVAQQRVPSGLAAVLFATFPVWVGLVARWLLPHHALTPP